MSEWIEVPPKTYEYGSGVTTEDWWDAGVEVKLADGETFLIGDFDTSGYTSGCGCCAYAVVDPDEIVVAYRVRVEVEG